MSTVHAGVGHATERAAVEGGQMAGTHTRTRAQARAYTHAHMRQVTHACAHAHACVPSPTQPGTNARVDGLMDAYTHTPNHPLNHPRTNPHGRTHAWTHARTHASTHIYCSVGIHNRRSLGPAVTSASCAASSSVVVLQSRAVLVRLAMQRARSSLWYGDRPAIAQHRRLHRRRWASSAMHIGRARACVCVSVRTCACVTMLTRSCWP